MDKKFPHLFHGIGKLHNFEAKLHVDSSVPPVAQPARRIPFHLRRKVSAALKQLEKDDIIEKVEGPTPWISPLVVIPKNDETVRLCVDMRRANCAIQRERHPCPTVDDLIHAMNGAKVFSKLDLRSGYHQLLLAEESRYITTFVTHKGLRRYKRLNFGTNSASELFQKVIHDQIHDIPGAINISDDVIIYGKSQQEHDTALHNVCQRFTKVGLTLNNEKCQFSQTKLTFFGMVFSAEGISADPHTVSAIKNASPPSSVKDVRSFLGMATYCAKFIPNFSHLREPLRKLTMKSAQFRWTRCEQTAFDNIKNALTSDTVMAYFDQTKPTELITDASPWGLSAILAQNSTQHDDRRIVAYVSRSLSEVERKYSQTEREALAIVWAMERLQTYLRGGSDNPSDFLSRHPCQETDNKHEMSAEQYVNFLTMHAVPKAMTIQEIQEATKHDKTLQLLTEIIRKQAWGSIKDLPTTGEDVSELNLFAKVRDELTINEQLGIILRGTRIIMPCSLREKAIRLAHEGHQGLAKTKQLIREKIWFPRIDKDVETLIRGCIPCQANGTANHPAPLKMTELPPKPWHTVHVDFCGPFPTGEYTLVVIDAYSRFPEVEIVKSTSATSTISKLERIFATHGLPNILKSDNGPPFQSNEFKQFMTENGIKHQRITPLWPKANSEAENFMKPMEKAIRAAHIEKKNWRKELYHFLLNYRATPHTTTKFAPAELLFNREINTELPSKIINQNTKIDQQVRANDEKGKRNMKRNADKSANAKEVDIKVGDTVLVRQTKKNKWSTRFDPKPYCVTRVKGTMITATRPGHYITRNISFFKKVLQQEIQHNSEDASDEEDYSKLDNNLPDTNIEENNELAERRYPARDRRPINRYGQNIYNA
ncbi:Transposon Ty3-I Gag-Pol poly [Paramuricea clavata]|uniref:Transposon Ty3-I Gag-Pol poly n=1 Tax=Paramuricea clavata TaxID=317549 RepID=A0A7D9JZ15_PARCT|nr:Transposon Ty3-I Gag-Pol poly [Paramuricea clavata]